MTTEPANGAAAELDEQHRLTVAEGLAALSLDALSSVAYGPEAILVVLVAAGATALHYSMPITGAIVILLAVLVVSYRQVIEAFPNGGGAYAVSKAHLGTQASLVASGCSALTGVETIANSVPEFRKPRVRRAQHTEMWLGILLGTMLIGLGILIRKFHVVPHSNITVLAQLTEASLGHNVVFYAVGLITTVLLALAANTSFGGLLVLASLLAKDNFLPHMFGLRADRQVHRTGVVVLAVLAAALLVASAGDTQALVPLFAVGVFVGFTLSQLGMVRHWRAARTPGWKMRAGINGFGALLTALTTIIELVSKFTEGALPGGAYP